MGMKTNGTDTSKSVELLWIARFDYKKGWILSSHAHEDFFQLIYFIEGSCTITVNDETLAVCAPVLLFLPPGTVHGITGITAKGLKSLDTKFRILDGELASYCRYIRPVMQISDDDICGMLEEIRQEGQDCDILYQAYCQSLFVRILIKLVRMNIPKDNPAAVKIFRTQEKELSPLGSKIAGFIEHNYLKRITASLLEENLNHSYRYLSKQFVRETGVTPLKFAEQFKVSKAKELLNYGDYELKHISEILRYNNVHEFSRTFRRVTGVPPAEWRRQARQGICKDVLMHPDFQNTLLIKKG
jgi:AraC-like DNA-binding protein